MNPAQVLAAILAIFPFMSGNNRACIQSRQARIVEQLTETTAAGVPPEIMASVAFVETHLGCDRNEGGNWGAPIDPAHRHTAGTHVHAARALLTGRERCGSWDGAIVRFRTGLCAARTPVGRRYLANVTRLAQRIVSLYR
jgi:hypothetical protein